MYPLSIERRVQYERRKKISYGFIRCCMERRCTRVENCLELGASPSWVFNGYPILMHAISIGNEEIVNILIDAGAIQKQEALGFALERGIGQMIRPLDFVVLFLNILNQKKALATIPKDFAARTKRR